MHVVVGSIEISMIIGVGKENISMDTKRRKVKKIFVINLKFILMRWYCVYVDVGNI